MVGNKLLLFGFILLLSLISIAFFAESNKKVICERSIELEGKSKSIYSDGCFFYEKDGLWAYFVNHNGKGFNLLGAYLPSELKDVSVSGELSNNFIHNEKFYFSHSSDNLDSFVAAGSFGILYFFNGFFDIDFSELNLGCLDRKNCFDSPVASCSSSNSSVGFFEFRVSEDNGGASIDFASDNCIVVSGSPEDIDKASQYLIYDFIGII